MKEPSSAPATTSAVEIPLTLLNQKTASSASTPIAVIPAQLSDDSLLDAISNPFDETDDRSDGNANDKSSRSLSWFRWGGTAVVALSLLEAGQFLYQQWQASYWWGGAWSVATGCLLVGTTAAIWREYRALRRLRINQVTRQQAETLRKAEQHGNAQAFCRQLATELNFHTAVGYQSWLEHIEAHHDDNEVLMLFSQFVLRPLDDKALQLVLKSSAQTALLVAASPLALADMLLVLWRNFKMLRDIADIYQVRLSYWGQIRLIRQILQNMVFAGAAELVTELGSDWFHAELTSKLSAKLAQGLGSGLLSARLGINTIQVCRPFVLLPDEKPKLSQIRRMLLKRLTTTVSAFFTTPSADEQKK